MKNVLLVKPKANPSLTSLLHGLSFVIMLLLIGAATVAQSPQSQAPVFRSRVDLLQLDVSVLDKNGVPVRGLTKGDFVILEDKKPQTIQGFTAVEIAEAPAAGPVWRQRVAPDVVSNEIDNQRIFVLVVDDALSMGLKLHRDPELALKDVPDPIHIPDPAAAKIMRDGVVKFISALGPTDLAALVFTNQTKLSQNLTADHARLLKAVEAFPIDGGGILNMPNQDRCLGEKYSVGAIESIVQTLAAVPDRRKAVIYFGGEMPWAEGPDRCFTYARWRETFAAAEQAHVTINPVDTFGLRPSGVTGKAERYLIVAEETGGHAVVASNDIGPGLQQIMVENSAYYLLAYAPTNDVEDGTFRRLTVSVKDRPDLDVRTRRSYWAPKRKAGDPDPPKPPPQLEALAGLLPVSQLSLRATAAPFAMDASASAATIAVAVGIRQPPFAARTLEQVELLIKAFTVDGDPKGSDSQTISVTVPAARLDREHSRYEVLARVDLPKPGKYQLRLSAHSGVADTRGSVYVDVEVPDFRKDPVSLSGVVLNNALAADPVAPARLLRDLVPVVPTSERTFATTDVITALVRVYQGGGNKVTPVPMKVTIADAAGKSVFSSTDTLAPDRFGTNRAADHQLRLPLATLSAGDYLLTLETTVGKTTAKRDVRFQVR